MKGCPETPLYMSDYIDGDEKSIFPILPTKMLWMKCYQQVKLIRSQCKVATRMHFERQSEF